MRPTGEGLLAARAPKDSAAVQAFLLPKEAAAIVRRSVKSFYRLLDADATLPRTTLPGGGLLIPRLAFERWLHERTEGMRGPLRPVVLSLASEAAATHGGAGALNGAGTR